MGDMHACVCTIVWYLERYPRGVWLRFPLRGVMRGRVLGAEQTTIGNPALLVFQHLNGQPNHGSLSVRPFPENPRDECKMKR